MGVAVGTSVAVSVGAGVSVGSGEAVETGMLVGVGEEAAALDPHAESSIITIIQNDPYTLNLFI